MIVCGTGHRPDKLLGYGYGAHHQLTLFAQSTLREVGATKVISGMALGWDIALAAAAFTLRIPFVAAVPFDGQESKWPAESQENYRFIRSFACEIVHVCEAGYAAWKMQRRNEWMVDNADSVLALWDGSSGGTANCIKYAQSKDRPIVNTWQHFEQYKARL